MISGCTNHALAIIIVPFGIFIAELEVDMWVIPSKLVRIVMIIILSKALPKGNTKFFYNSIDNIWQRRTIVKTWEMIWANDSVNFYLNFLLHVRIECHRQERCFHG